jgi:hypothetical protein
MPFTGIYGLPGRGKSLLMLQHGLRIADKYRLRLVTNFLLDPVNLAYYCKVNNYKWLFDRIPEGIIYYVSANKNFAQFLQIQDSVILLDEMGLYAPAAQHWTLPPEAFNAVANNRKRCQHIVYAAQYPSQVHSSIHQVCSEILYAEGRVVWDEKLRNDRLLFKDIHLFGPSEFEVWFRDPKIRKNPIKVWVLALKHWKGPISSMDVQTFRCYDSFGLLEEQDLNTNESKEFGYQPYIIDSSSRAEISASELAEKGYSFAEIEEKLDSYYQAERFNKKKRIYEASGSYAFVAWKLTGNIPFPGPHPLSGKIKVLWEKLPSNSYEGLKKIDLKIHREFMVWHKMSAADRHSIIWFFKSAAAIIFAVVIGSFILKLFL